MQDVANALEHTLDLPSILPHGARVDPTADGFLLQLPTCELFSLSCLVRHWVVLWSNATAWCPSDQVLCSIRYDSSGSKGLMCNFHSVLGKEDTSKCLPSDSYAVPGLTACDAIWEGCAEPPVLLQSSQASSQSLGYAMAYR